MNIEDAVRQAAASGPAYAGDLATIQRRGRRYAHRRTAMTAGAATAVLGVGSAAFAVGLPHHSAPTASPSASAVPSGSPSVSPSVSPSPEVPSAWTSDQRLVIIGMSGWAVDGRGGDEQGLNGPVEIDSGNNYPSVMLPDGRIVAHKFGITDRSSVDQFVPLPDGRFVVLRTVNVGASTKPDPSHPDGASNPSIRTRLQILDSHEKIKLSHEVRRSGEYVQLLAATGDAAYLARPKGVYRHDFATGRETLLVTTGAIGVDLSEGIGTRASLEGNRLAVATGDYDKPWSVDVFDLTTGQRIASYSLAGLGAIWVDPVRVSPDGTRVAMLYRTMEDSRVAVLDVATHAVLTDKSLVDPADPVATMLRRDFDERVRGVAWSDDHTLRIAWAQLPPGAKGKYDYNKLTRVHIIVVG